ncbi:hypothetical protein FS837_011280 [Tulasnella sp. UAMH 9824]|nr:hypothetical protein FS837_011280 [Tulasnella sp. UAMH 9824]
MSTTPDPTSPGKTPKARSRNSLVPSPIRIGSPASGTPTASPARDRLSPNPSAFGNTPLPTSPIPPTPKGRARDLLRKHYGLGLPIPTPTGNPTDPMDVDSTAFDAKAYYDQLITVSTLSGLLKRENELVSEIRNLESDRQALVYNHHHELIAASDTIRAMKQRADSLDVDLEKLKAAFSEISRLSLEVTDEDVPQSPSTPKRPTPSI